MALCSGRMDNAFTENANGDAGKLHLRFFCTVKLGFVGASSGFILRLRLKLRQRDIVPLETRDNPPKPLYGA